jgi:hypothetical protein
MPPRGVKKGSKRERQYEHIKDSERKQGASLKRAEEIAARTVNKERARSGESKTSSRTSTGDISSGRRGGLRSGKPGPRGRTREQLYRTTCPLQPRKGCERSCASCLQIRLVSTNTTTGTIRKAPRKNHTAPS